jgi:hypothetical protein
MIGQIVRNKKSRIGLGYFLNSLLADCNTMRRLFTGGIWAIVAERCLRRFWKAGDLYRLEMKLMVRRNSFFWITPKS